MAKNKRTNIDLVAERLIHTAEALGLAADPDRRKVADRYRKILERQLERDRKNARGQLQPA
jgi:hypothetical protein